MTRETRRIINASVLSTLTGGLLGFGLGLLVAPDEGQQIRRRLAYLIDRWANQAGAAMERMRSEVLASDARATGDALVEDARERARQLVEEADALMEKVRREQKD